MKICAIENVIRNEYLWLRVLRDILYTDLSELEDEDQASDAGNIP